MLQIPPPSLAERARWAVALYSVSVEYGQEQARGRDRRAGIQRYKNAPVRRLRTDLEPVLKTYPDGTLQYSAAAYVLARYGVDVERNAKRLFQSARMDRKTADENRESLPEALADLWSVRRSHVALRHLVTMPSDAHVGEEQAYNLARLIRITPDAVLRETSRSQNGWEQLVFGVNATELPKASGIKEKALFERLRRDVRRLSVANRPSN